MTRPLTILADLLDPAALPQWLQEAAFQRIGRMMMQDGPMSWRMLAGIAIDYAGTPAPQRSLQRVILSFQQGSSWPLSALQERAGTSRSTTIRSLAELYDAGWLHVEKSTGGKSRYWTTIPLEVVHNPCQSDTTHPCQSDTTPCQSDTGTGVRATPQGYLRDQEGDEHLGDHAQPVDNVGDDER